MHFIDDLDNAIGEAPKYRKNQALRAIFKSAYENWEQATDLPLDLRAQLAEKAPLTIESRLVATGDENTIKALVGLSDGRWVETVLIRSPRRNTVCISTQVGCAMGCVFCASGKGGFIRNLTLGEIVGQVVLFSRMLKASGDKVTNVVFMGMGEPLLNYAKVIGAIRLLNQADTLNVSTRRFSISTCGILPGIAKLSRENALDANLAVSLHSAIDKKRVALMPINKQFPLGDLAKTLRVYFERTKRKIMFEYILLKDTNTFEEDARALRKFLSTVKAAYVVNLMRLNETGPGGYEAAPAHEVALFKDHLKNYGISFVQRLSYGKDISAACGQLRSSEAAKTGI